MYIKTFELNSESSCSLKFYIIENNKFIAFFKKFFYVPSFITIKKEIGFLSFCITNFKYKNTLDLYFSFFLRFIKSSTRSYFKKLILKGLGFRITFIENPGFLRFKLGFSHFVDIKIPLKLKVYVRKNSLYLFSLNCIVLGNFCKKIQSIKAPNSYSGKGFWDKDKKQTVKSFKKK
jgi:ribosomal protein L6P/L9E